MTSSHRSTSGPRAASALLLALAMLPAAAGATVVVPMSDAELADRTPLIVEARVLAVEPAPGERPATDYLVQVEGLIKGRLPGNVLVVRVPGGVRSDGIALHLWGAPRLRAGEDALLFLKPGRDGTFVLHQFVLGAFRISGEAPARMATRDLSAVRVITPPGGAAPRDGPRDLEKLRRWLADRGRGRLRPADYFLDPAADGPAALPEKFQTIVTSSDPPPLGCGENGGHGVRWFDFDFGGRIGWRTHFSGQAGVADGGIEAFRDALATWTGDPNTPIDYGYDGLTAAIGGLSGADGTNAILFGDPNDEIGGSFEGSGILAVGGPWFECMLLEHEGESFHSVIAADIVTQDGLEPFFAAVANPARAAEQVFAHELGHTLGLAHSAETEALMFADFHADGRGAALHADDLAGMLYLYGPRGLRPPAAPSGLAATAGEALAVALEWSDNSGNESLFRLERRASPGGGSTEPAEDFELVATLTADTTSFVDTGVSPESLYAYRLRAANGAGASAWTAEAEVLTPEDPRPAAPTNLRAAPLSSSEIRLVWQDNSDDETRFVLAILLDSAWVDIPFELPPETRRVIVEGLTPDADFRFRVRAANAFGASAPSNPAVTRTFSGDDACVVTGDELCLLGGRFKVSVDYRNQHVEGEEGPATVVPSTDESGLFYFFEPENIELIVKVLDGRHINQHFWTFYGALSDLEYWVTVEDTATGSVEVYHNPPTEICGLADTAAFPDEPVDVPNLVTAAAASRKALDVASLTLVAEEDVKEDTPSAGTCTPSPERLCLLGGRLSAEVTWTNHHDGGTQGPGRAIVDTDNTGYFWFFNIENTELVVKALDGGALNDHLWIFYGALSDLEYSMTVTDTLTGESRVYHTAAGEVCGQADVEAFPAVPEEPPDDDGPDEPDDEGPDEPQP